MLQSRSQPVGVHRMVECSRKSTVGLVRLYNRSHADPPSACQSLFRFLFRNRELCISASPITRLAQEQEWDEKPLEGIKVVEVAMWAFVPVAGGILSDMGANVIKVEPPTGDPLRGLSTGLSERESTIDFSWESYNRGKRSITLDLKQEAGREVLYRLLEGAEFSHHRRTVRGGV